MKIRLDVELRIPGRLAYQFFHIPNINLEVDMPDEFIVQYPNDDIIYLTTDGLAYLDRELCKVLREETVKDYEAKDIEEGWA